MGLVYYTENHGEFTEERREEFVLNAYAFVRWGIGAGPMDCQFHREPQRKFIEEVLSGI